MAEPQELGPEEALEKLSEQVTCAVCLQPYTSPKQLQCFHVFCQSCLEGMTVTNQASNTSTITCALCRRDTTLPSAQAAVHLLPSAFHMNNLLEIQAMLNKLRDAVKPGSDREWSQEPQQDLTPCLHHSGEKATLFCETCVELVCVKCTIHAHNGHRYDLIKEVFEKKKEELIRVLEPVEVSLNTMRRAMSKYHARGEDILAQKRHIETEVNSAVEKLQAAVRQKGEEIMRELNKLVREKLTTLEAEKCLLQMLQSRLSSSVECVQSLLENRDKGSALMSLQTVREGVEQVCKDAQHQSLEPRERANLALTTNLEPSLESLKGIASLSTYSECPEKCYASGAGLSSANMGSTTTAMVFVVDEGGKPCKEDCIGRLECEIESEVTGSRVSGSIVSGSTQRKREGQYQVSYQPLVKGRHKLHITINREHIRGSPFPLLVKSTHPSSLKESFWSVRCVKQPRGLAVKQSGELLAASEQEEGILLLEARDGLLNYSSTEVGTGCFVDVSVGEENHLYVVESRWHKVLKFTEDGQLVHTTEKPADTQYKLNYPMGVAYNTKSKKVYISNTYSHQVQVYNTDLTLHKAFGGKGARKGQFNYPWGIACDTAGRVLVADSENDRVQVFTPEGKPLRQFGRTGSRPGELKWPIGIATDASNFVYVSEGGNCRVSVFSAEGGFVRCVGEEGGMVSPRGVAVEDSTGIVFLCDQDSDNILLY